MADPKTYILYHGNCYDGFGSAWAAWKVFKDNACYIACSYADGTTELDKIPDQSEVYILDFSFARDVLIAAHSRMKKLIVLDHHATAADNLKSLDFCIFDMERSGAMLSWMHFHPGKEPPALIKHIEDRDLWLFKLPQTEYVHLALLTKPFDFIVWDQLDIEQMIAQGEVLYAMRHQQIEAICSRAGLKLVGIDLVPVVNTSVFFSEVPQRLLELYPDSKFAAYYFDYFSDKKNAWIRQWGLRSRRDFDVSEVAKKLGGGGHKQAAGFVEFLRG